MNQPPKTIITDVDTELGNTIIEQLQEDGWKITSQYNTQKQWDIDFDTFTLNKNGYDLRFSWDNWLEWKITGPAKILELLNQRYSLDSQDI